MISSPRSVKKVGVYFFLFSLLIGESLGQEISFTHILQNNGLFSGNVTSFLQDSQGFMWIGTDDGLFRYDGYETAAFKYDYLDRTSISDNYIVTIFEDSNNGLWIGTSKGGVNFYNRKKNRFIRFTPHAENDSSLHENSITFIYEDQNKNIYFGSHAISSINLRDFQHPYPHHLVFKKISIPLHLGQRPLINCIITGFNGDLWFGTTYGIYSYAPLDTLIGTLKPFLLTSKNITTMLRDTKDRLWIGSVEDGIQVYSKSLAPIARFNLKPGSTLDPYVKIIKEDAEGNIWIGTLDGLGKFNSENDPKSVQQLVFYQHSPSDPKSLLSNSIQALYFDHDSRMWVSTLYGGINIYDPNFPRFKNFRPSPQPGSNAHHGNVTALAHDNQGQLWVGMDGSGLHVLSLAGQKLNFKNLHKVPLINSVTQRKEESIKCIATDHQGYVWIGTWGGGLFRLNSKTHQIRHYWPNSKKPEQSIATPYITAIKAAEKNLWIANFKGGINCYYPQKDSFSLFPVEHQEIPIVNDIAYSSKHQKLWSANQFGGLYTLDISTGKWSAVAKGVITPSLTISTITLGEEEKDIWIGSPLLGLIHYNIGSKKINIYDQEQGLTNYKIYGILEDHKNSLWISTNSGLFRFDKKNKQFINYSKEDGLQGNQYNPNSFVRVPDGLVLFGGIEGLTYFYPEHIRRKYKFPPIQFTHFWLQDKEINEIDSLTPISKSISEISHLTLDHTQNSFSLAVAAIDLMQTGKIDYQYQLTGLHTRWQNLGPNRKITFTNLEPGKYELRVRASNREKQWPNNYKTLNITITPAWWQTLEFRIALVILVLFIAWGVHRVRLNFLIAHQKLLKRVVHERTQELATLNNEIMTQNEELISQNDNIIAQRHSLEQTQEKLKSLNQHLEDLVNKRTVKLEKTIHELDKTFAELDRFVYSASHELGAPLKSILGLLNIAKKENDPKLIIACHNHIETSILKLEQVIKNLADYSRNSHVKLEKEPLYLDALVDIVIDELKIWPESNNVSLINQIPKNYVMHSDAGRLKIILYNLIGNGIKYADHEKPKPHVIVSLDNRGPGITLLIADNGTGIDVTMQDKIFEMYFRGTNRASGSGLGLFIVKETVNTLEGMIALESNSALGSVFCVSLPE